MCTGRVVQLDNSFLEEMKALTPACKKRQGRESYVLIGLSCNCSALQTMADCGYKSFMAIIHIG